MRNLIKGQKGDIVIMLSEGETQSSGGEVTTTVKDLSIPAAPNAILFECGACHKGSQIFFVIIFIYSLQKKKKVIPLYLSTPVSIKEHVKEHLTWHKNTSCDQSLQGDQK